jgi:hypothetical protein
METTSREATIIRPDAWDHWPVYWSGIWVGVLAAFATALIIGLIAMALGAHQMSPQPRIANWRDVGPAGLIFAVAGAFFAGAVGGWVATRIAGIRRSESAALHGAIVWLVGVPILLTFAALGAGTYFGSWYSSLAGVPAWATPSNVSVDPNAATAARNGALGALTALLIGLMGSVIGGWMGSGEPMTLASRTRATTVTRRAA